MKLNLTSSFTDHSPALVSPEKAAWFQTCLESAGTFLSENHERLETASTNDTEDFWGELPDNAWVQRFRPYVVKDGVLQIPVKGVLLHDFPYTAWGMMTGYEYIWRAFQRGMEDSNVKGIALVVDSPGGMVAGCFECVDRMFALRGTKPVVGFAAESAYSAAYAVISVADSIVVTRTGGVGSIGVVTSHMDVSGALEQAGYKITFIYAGAHKVDGNSYAPLPDDVKARIQTRIDDLYSIFVSTVSRNRKLDEQAIRDTEALTYGAPESLSIGLADKIGAFDDALADFTASLQTSQQGDETMADFSQAQFDEGVASARNDGVATGKAEGAKEGAAAERARVSAILGSDEAQGRSALANHLAFNTSMSVDDAKGMLAVAAKEAPAAPVAAPAAAGAGVGQERFDSAMTATGNPNVGENAQSTTDQPPHLEILGFAKSVGLKAFN